MKSLLQAMTITFFTLAGMVLVGACSLWLYLAYNGLHFVRMADYRVSIPSEPQAAGRLFSLSRGEYLLALADESSGHREAYYIDLSRREIGLPSFDPSRYECFSRSALVDERVLEKYPVLGMLMADWRAGQRDVNIRIMGRPAEVERFDPIYDPDKSYQRSMPIAYKTQVILTRNE